MKAKLKTRWLEALRSDRYKQIFGTLRDRRGFCALGVFCDIASTDGWEQLRNGRYILNEIGDGRGQGSDTFLANMGVPIFEQNVISSMNDSGWKTFREIADYIEAKIKETP